MKKTLYSLRKEIKELKRLREAESNSYQSLMNAYRETSKKLEEEKKKNDFRNVEKHHIEISRILQSLAVTNESIAKIVMSINNHL
jgi:mevalonate kinase